MKVSKLDKLEKFKKDFEKLLKKHPDISVYCDINGNPIAHGFLDGKPKTIRLR